MARCPLPELGPIGSNGLANPRDFSFAGRFFEDQDGHTNWFRISRRLWTTELDHSTRRRRLARQSGAVQI